MPQFSVIICNYNYGRYIGQCIRSVLNQTVADFELIIVDDGSTDDSREVIRSFQDSRIRTIFKENGGQASAFNAGFFASCGELVSFLDSDDFWDCRKLEETAKIFATTQSASVYHRLELVDSESRRKGQCHPSPGYAADCTADPLLRLISSHDLVSGSPTSSMTFRRPMLANVFPIPEHWRICADVRLWFALLHGPLYASSLILGSYREHGKNGWWKSRDIEAKRHRMKAQAYRELQAYIKARGSSIKIYYFLSPVFYAFVRFRFGAVVAMPLRVFQRMAGVVYPACAKDMIEKEFKVFGRGS